MADLKNALVKCCLLLFILFAKLGFAAPGDPFAAPSENLQLASVHAQVTAMDSGEVLFGKHPETIAPIASITKLMTAMVVLDSAEPLDEWLAIFERDRPAPANAWSRLRVGSEATRRDLLRIALMASENLAAHNLGRHHPGGYDAFVAAMNAKAKQLGMQRTRFVDSTGLSGDNRSTAADLSRLVAAAWNYELICDYSTTSHYTLHLRNPRYHLNYGNTNRLTRSDRWQVDLSKTGYLDEAGRCLVMVAWIHAQPVAVVLLNSFGSQTPLGDAGRIRRWLETGNGGPVAGPALAYERRQTAALVGDAAAAAEP